MVNPEPAPTHIRSLKPHQVFVFGSNARGHHLGGAARSAWRKFGARWGQGRGHHGRSYAIDTMSGDAVLEEQVKTFLAYAREQPGLEFLMTPIGCGIAGRSPADVAPWFRGAGVNVRLPQTFIDHLEGSGR